MSFLSFVIILVKSIILYFIGELVKRNIDLFEYFGKKIDHTFTEDKGLLNRRKKIGNAFYVIGISIQILAVLQLNMPFLITIDTLFSK